MKLFLDDRTNQLKDEVNVTITSDYIELELECNKSSSMFLYIVPISEHSAFVLMCFGEMFDWLYKKSMEELVKEAKSCPVFLKLVTNGINDQYENGALIQLLDNDIGDNRWFVASTVDEVKFDHEEGIFTEDMSEAIIMVMDQAYALYQEMKE